MFSFFLKHEDLFGQRGPSLVWSLLDLANKLRVAIVLARHCHLYVLHLPTIIILVIVIRERLLSCKASVTGAITCIVVEWDLVFVGLSSGTRAYREVHCLFSLLNVHAAFTLQS